MIPEAEPTGMGDGWRPLHPTLSVFESIAGLYSAATPEIRTVVHEAGERWLLDPAMFDGEGVKLWGNPPANGGSPRSLTRWAYRREQALRRLRGDIHGCTVRAIHRLPPSVRAGPVPQRVREALMGGVVVELNRGERYLRAIDEVVAAAGARPRVHVGLRPSRDGSALVRLRDSRRIPFELRVAALGGRKDPAKNAEALIFLEGHGVLRVPRPRGRGTTRLASWTGESVLEGRRPRGLSRAVHEDLATFCAQLPATEAPATSLGERMLLLADRYPRWAALAGQLAEHPLPMLAIVQHGDLWIGNALVSRGRLSGVIDWDTWHPSAVPGADLLQLHAMRRRQRTGEEIGALWSSGFWRLPEFLEATRGYWRSLRVEPTDEVLEGVGLDWWAGQLFKRQSFASRPGWIEDNIDRVLIQLNGGP
jgi:hypothetical protein